MRSPRRHERGIVIVLVAIAMFAVLIMVGLAIDTGRLVLNKSRLQSTVDAAALAAAKVLDQTRNEDGATAAAESVFSINAAAHPDHSAAIARVTRTVQYSNTLRPFVPGSTPPEYVRVIAENLPTPTSFLTLLGYTELFTRASAVAGPSAPIVSPCGLFPVAVCADMAKGPPHWGYVPYGEAGNTVTLLKLASSAAGSTFGPGNFQLIRLGGTGADVVRRNLAGGAACSAAPGGDAVVDPQPGNVIGAVAQGVNTRFGQYSGSLGRGAADYPPDYFTTPSPATPLASPDGQTITYNGKAITGIDDVAYSYRNYLADYASGDYGSGGRAQRRVVNVPIVDCTNSAHGTSSTLPVRAFGCFFLLQPVEHGGGNGWIFAQFLKECAASGNPGQQGGEGPYTIVLHNDPDSPDS